MKTETQLRLVSLGIIVILILAGSWLLQENNRLKTLSEHQESVITEQNAEIQYRIGKEGRLIAEKEVARADVNTIMKAYPALVEDLKRDFDVKLKNMKAYIRNEFEARGQGVSTVTNNYYDTTTHKTYRKINFDDGYLSFESFIDSTNTALSTYVYSDTIKTVVHRKKAWFLGNEKLFSSTSLSNPNARVTGTTNILVDNHKDKRYVIAIGVYGDPIQKSYGVGITVGYALIKF